MNIRRRKAEEATPSQIDQSRDDDRGRRAHTAESVDSLLFFKALAITALFVVVGLAAFYRLPTAKPESAPLNEFSEARARKHIVELSDNIGVRLVGSHNNEVLAVQYLLGQIHAIQEEALKASKKGVKVPHVEVSVQHVSGALSFEMLGGLFTNAYSNVTNIIVRVSATPAVSRSAPKGAGIEDGEDVSALLVSSHFDTAWSSPAASDATSGIAIMMESLRILATSDRLPHTVIFNFNGAEETLLQAAHGFITKHPWADQIQAFINLEAAGAGGPALLFQIGPNHGWLAEAFAKVAPHPRGSSLAQDIFQSGVIPSDTDFRIYRDFGKTKQEDPIPGYDFAYFCNGYVYHTHLDRLNMITEGSIQQLGDNVLALIKYLAASAELVDPPVEARNSHFVYTDVFGFYTIIYSRSAGQMFNFVVCIVALFEWYKLKVANKLQSLLVVILGLVLSILPAVSTALLVAAGFGNYMSWFPRPGFGVLLYGLPSLIFFLFVIRFISRRNSRKNIPLWEQEMSLYWGVTMFFTLGLAILNHFGLDSAYFFMFLSASCLISFSFAAIFKATFRMDGWQVALPMALVVPIIYGTYVMVHVVNLMHIVGRIGVQHIWVGDVAMAVLASVQVVFLALILLPFSVRLSSKQFNGLVRSLFAVLLVCIVATFFLMPYDDTHPKRLLISHLHEFETSNLTVHAKTDNTRLLRSSIVVSHMDSGPMDAVSLHVAEQHALGLADHTIPPLPLAPKLVWKGLYPLSVFFTGYSIENVSVHEPLLTVPDPSNPSLPGHALRPDVSVASDVVSGVSRTLAIETYTGAPCWSTLHISMKNEDSVITSWSLTDHPLRTCSAHLEGCVYIIRHAGGIGSGHFNFNFTISPPSSINLFFSTKIPDFRSPVLEKWTKSLPSWTAPLTLVATIQEYNIA